jgi:hypothetical protein
MLLSVNKILMLIAILTAVWYGFKLIGRLDKARKLKAKNAPRRGPAQSNRSDQSETIDLVRGEDGKTFHARDTDDRS